MAKNKKNQNQYDFESDHDDLNFDDFETDFNEVGESPNEDRSIVTGTAKAFGSGVMDELIGKDKVFANIKRLGRGLVPEDIQYATEDISGIYESTADSFRKAKGIIKPTVVKTAKTIKSLVPSQLKLIHDRLDGFINDNDESKLNQESEAAQLETNITNSISSIFDKQIAVQIQTEAVNKAEKAFDDHQQTERYKTNINILSSIEQGITQLSSYNLQINREYQKKSLELQFRSFYTQVETLKTIKTYFELFKNQNEAITKNTSLPDFVKIKTTEKMIDVSRERLFSNMYDKMYSKGTFLNKVKTNINNKVIGAANDIKFGMDSALDGYEMAQAMGMGPINTVIGSVFGGQFAGSWLDKLEGKIRDKYGGAFKNFKTVKGMNQAAQIFRNDPALMFSNMSSGFGNIRNKLDNNQYDPTKGFVKKGMSKLGSSLFGGLEDMTRFRGENTLNTEIKADSMVSAESPAVFDRKTQRSIIDVIPMYLARILQQSTRTADHFKAPPVGLLKYDYNSRLLVDDKTAKDSLTKSIKSLLVRGEGNNKRDTLTLLDNQMTDKEKDDMLSYLDSKKIDINSTEDLTKALSRDDLPPSLKEAANSIKRKFERMKDKDRRIFDYRIDQSFNASKGLDENIRRLLLLGKTMGASIKEVESLKIIFTIHIMTGGELKLSQLKDFVQKLPTHVSSSLRIVTFIKNLYGDVETQADASVLLSSISKYLKNEVITNPDALLRLIDDLGFESRDSMIEAGIMSRNIDTGSLEINGPMVASLLLNTNIDNVDELNENQRSETTKRFLDRMVPQGSPLSRADFIQDAGSLKNLSKMALYDGTKASLLGARNTFRAVKTATTRYYQAGRTKKLLKEVEGDLDSLYQEARAKAMAKSPEALEAFDRVFKKADDFKTLITESSTFKGLSNETLHFYSQRTEDLKKIKDLLKDTKAGKNLTKVLGSVYNQVNSIAKNTRTMVTKFLNDSEVMGWVKHSSEELWLKLTDGVDGKIKLDTLTQDEFEQIVGILRDNGLELTKQSFMLFQRTIRNKAREALKLAKKTGTTVKDNLGTKEARSGLVEKLQNLASEAKTKTGSFFNDVEKRGKLNLELINKGKASGQTDQEINATLNDSKNATELYRSIESIAAQNKGTPIREIDELKDVPEEVLAAFENLVNQDSKLKERLEGLDEKTDENSKKKTSDRLKKILGKVGVGGGLLGMLTTGAAFAGETSSGAVAAGTLLSGISLVDMGITAALVGVGVFGTRKLVSHLKNNKGVQKKFKDLQTNLVNFTTGLRDSIVDTVKNTLTATKKMFTNILNKGKDIIKFLTGGQVTKTIGDKISNVKNGIKDIASGAVNTVKGVINVPKKIKNTVMGAITKTGGLFSKIKGKLGKKIEKVDSSIDNERMKLMSERNRRKSGEERGADALDRAEEYEQRRAKEQEDEVNAAKARNQKKETSGGGIFGGMLDGIKKIGSLLALSVVPLLGKLWGSIKGIGKSLSFLGPVLKGVGNAAKFIGTKVLAPAGRWLAAGGARLIGGALLRMTPIGILATVAWGAYKTYDLLTRNNAGEATRIRLRQYGLKEEDKSIYHLLFGLEEFLKDKFVNNGGSFSLKPLNREEMVEVFEKFEVDYEKAESKQQADMFATWMNKRFIPIYIEHKRALEAVKPGTDLKDIDKLKPDDLLKYIDQLHVKPSVYDIQAGINYKLPSITITKDEIVEYIKTVREKAKKAVLESIDKDVATLGNKVPLKKETRTKASHTGFCPDGSYSPTGSCKEAGAAKPPAIAGDPAQPALGNPAKPAYEPSKPLTVPEPSGDKKGEDGGPPGLTGVTINAPKLDEGKLAKAKGTLVKGDQNSKFIRLDKGVRLEGVNPRMLELLYGMIEEYGQLTGKPVIITDGHRTREEQAAIKQKFIKQGKGDMAADPGTSMHEFGLAVDINSPDADAMEKLGLMRKYGFTRPVGREPWHVESALVSFNKSNVKNNKELATDLIDKSIGLGGGGLGTNPKSSKGGRDPKLQMEAAKADLSQEVDQSSMVNINKPSGIKAFSDPNTVKSDYPRSQSTPVETINELNAGAVKSNAATFGIINSTNPYTREPENALMPSGKKYSENDEKKIKDRVKMLTNNGDSLAVIEDASKKTGVPVNNLKSFAIIESSLNAGARNKAPGQSATGLFQFTTDTWNKVVAKYGANYGIDASTPRTDPLANAIMGAELYKENSKAIGSTDPVDVYLGHHYGSSKAKEILRYVKNNPDTPMTSIVSSEVYSANASEIGNKTASQYYTYLKDKMGINFEAINRHNNRNVTESGKGFNDKMKDIKTAGVDGAAPADTAMITDQPKTTALGMVAMTPYQPTGNKNTDRNIKNSKLVEINPTPELNINETTSAQSAPPNQGFIKTSATMNAGAPSPDVVSTMRHNADVTNKQMDSSIEVLNEQLKTQKEILGTLMGIAKLISPEVIRSYMQTSPNMTTNSLDLNRKVPA